MGLPLNATYTDPGGIQTLIGLKVDNTGRLMRLGSSTPGENAAALSSGPLSAAGQTPDQSSNNCRGLQLFVDVTAVSGTLPTLTVYIEGKDPVSGKYVVLLQSAALAAVGTYLMTVYPGAIALANLLANQPLSKTWRVRWAVGGTGSPTVTATFGASLIV